MKSKNHLAFQILQILGFSRINIRQALPKLTGITQEIVAKETGMSRQNITNTIGGYRANRKLQEQIASAWQIPVDDLFPGKSKAA